MGTITTMGELVRTHAAERPDAPALTLGDRTLSYADLDERSSRVAQGLLAVGVAPQERVAFLDKNCLEYFEILFGAGKVNAVSVAVNWRLASGEMAHIVNDSQARVLFIGEEFVPQLAEFREKLDHVETVIVIGSAPDLPSYEDWLASYPADDPDVPSAADDVCYQLYTSGTTGLPKGAMLTNANFFTLLPAGSEEWGFGPGDVNLVVMPLFHIAGSGWGVVGLFNGCHCVMLRDVDLQAILRLIPEYGVTHALFVPAVLQFLLATPGVESTDFSSLRTIVYGASPITEDVLVKAMQTFRCGFIQAYGLTETTGGVVILRPEDHDPGGPNAHRLRAAGVPWQGVDLKIVDPETLDEVPTGEVGEVWVRSPQVMKGYWNMPEETAKCITEGGWFRSGDAGYVDEDGYLYIHDRVKDMIISGGENIYPAEIENCLMSHPGVADVAVLGVPDERWGETVKAIVVKAAGGEVTEPDVIAYARDRLAHYKCPTSVDWAEALPRNPSGKLLKKDIRAPYWQGQERQVH